MKLNRVEYQASEFSKYGEKIQSAIKACLQSLESDYSSDDEICDAIMEVSDTHVSIWTTEVLDQARYLNYDIAEVLREGLVDISADSFDLVKLLQAVWYTVNEQGCYAELQEVGYNYMINFLNDAEADFTGDIDELESELWDAVRDINNDSSFYELEESAVLTLASWLELDGDDGVKYMRTPAQGLCALLEAQDERDEECQDDGKECPKNRFARIRDED